MGAAYVYQWNWAEPTYPTLFANNGPKHRLVPGILLGEKVDAEPDAYPTARCNGDDVSEDDDEDGVAFVTPLNPGLDARVDVEVVGEGYLN